MKRLFYLSLVMLAFTACKKKKPTEPTPTPDSLYHYWSLDFTSRPFSQDGAAWQTAAFLATGRTTITLSANGTYTGQGLLGAAGTFTVQDSATYKILTISNAYPPHQRVYVQVLSASEMIMDTQLGTQSQSYVRWKFGLLK